MNWTISKILTWTESYFTSNAIESPRLTAEILLSHVLHLKRIDLYIQHDRPLSKNELSDYKYVLKRRLQREPVEYITGKRGFWNLDFMVPPGVLIPRSDTETLMEIALECIDELNPLDKPKKIIELGCGSGALIVSLTVERAENIYFATDLSFEALEIARQNAGLHNKKRNLYFFQTSWFEGIQKEPLFDVIISNPPYIPTDEILSLESEIKDHEPILALDGGSDGLKCIEEIIENAAFYLTPGGFLLLEIGHNQKEGVTRIEKETSGMETVRFVKDLTGNLRVAVLKKTLSISK